MDELTNLTSAAPYKDDLYKQLIAEWIIPASENGPQSSVADSAQQLNGFDKVTLDNTTIALLAIYQRKQLTAVLALQRIGTPITYVQLTKGADINGIELADINRRHIVLQHGAEQVRLQLFNPNSAVPDDKHKSVK
ncbi:hypothetical protein [Rheinheimera aquimaris]|uniref:hypothetical protein n=1 Tax=Rheinheimera aquimaris TaxID=412437 RepID=UPI001E5C0790|nr:hypothetical protein [Rheinheimera aquimaris]MCD1599850.1 hypothetical protein [Rheinheimera aquimaris]